MGIKRIDELFGDATPQAPTSSLKRIDELFGEQAVPAPVVEDNVETASAMQEHDPSIGVPTDKLAIHEVLTQLSPGKLPNDINEAISLHEDQGLSIPKTGEFAQRVQKHARGLAMAYLERNGLVRKGQTSQYVDNSLMKDLVKGFQYISAGVLADMSEEEEGDILDQSMGTYIQFTKKRLEARINETIANNQMTGVPQTHASRQTLNEEGQQLVAKLDRTFGDMLKLERATDQDTNRSMWRSFTSWSHQQLQKQRGIDEVTAQELRLNEGLLNKFGGTTQDHEQLFQDSFDDLSRLEQQGERRAYKALVAAHEFSTDIEDRLTGHRIVQKSFDGALDKVRANRLGPGQDVYSALFNKFPELGLRMAEATAKSNAAKKLQMVDRSNRDISKQIKEEALKTFPGIVERLASSSLVPTIEALNQIQIRDDTGSSILNGIAKLSGAAGSVFEGLKEEVGSPLLNAASEVAAVPGKIIEVLGTEVPLTATSEEQALKAASDALQQLPPSDVLAVDEETAIDLDPSLGEKERLIRKIDARRKGYLRVGLKENGWVLAAEEAMRTVEASIDFNKLKQEEADAPVLREDLSNLREVLKEAEERGSFTFAERRSLFYEDSDNLAVSLAALWADDLSPKTVRRFVDAGFGEGDLKTLFSQHRKEAFKKLGFVGGSLEEISERREALEKRLASFSPFRRGTKNFIDSMSLLVLKAQEELQGNVESFLVDPKNTGEFFLGGLVLGSATNRLITPIHDRAIRSINNAAANQRLRRVVQDVSRKDPEAVHAQRKFLMGVTEELKNTAQSTTKKQRRFMELLEASTNSLEQISKVHGRSVLGNRSVRNSKMLDQASRVYREHFRQLGTDIQDRVADAIGLTEEVMTHVKNTGRNSSLIGNVFRAFKEKFNLDGQPVKPWVQNNSAKVATTVINSLDRQTPTDWHTLASSLDATRFPDKLARSVNDHRYDQFTEVGNYVRQSMEWGIEYDTDAFAVRSLQARIRSNQVNFLETMENKYRGQLSDLDTAAPDVLDLSDEVAGAKAALKDRISRVNRHRETLDLNSWDTPTRLSQQDYIKDATVADLTVWARTHAAENELEFWKEMRKPGESIAKFNTRVNRMVIGEGKPEDIESFRRKLSRNYLDSPGLNSKQRFDTRSGLALTAQKAQQLAGERKSAIKARNALPELEEQLKNSTTDAEKKSLKAKIANAQSRARYGDPDFTDEVLNETLGIREVDLKTKYQAMKELARTEDALSAAGVLENLHEMSDGKIGTILRKNRDAKQTILFNAEAQKIRNLKLMERYNRLTPEEQELYGDALSAVDDAGSVKKLIEAKKNDRIRALFLSSEKDKDFVVKTLFEDHEDLRSSILRDAAEAGVLSQEEFDTLIGSYAPHAYTRSFLKSVQRKVIGESGTTELGLDLSEMLSRRHNEKVRLLVHVRGGQRVAHLFDDKKEAQAFLKKEYGTKGKAKQAHSDVQEGKTALGDTYTILEPIGNDRAATLGQIDPGPALFSRLETLIQDMANAHVLKTLDRPGWTMTEAQFKARLNSPERFNVVENFTQLPNTRTYGPLRNKYVHRRIADEVEEIKDTGEALTFVQQILQDMENEGVVRKTAAVGWTLAKAIPKVSVDAIIANQVTRSYRTIALNMLMDTEVFGRAAIGHESSILHPRGWASKMRAALDLFSKKPSAEYLEAIRHGVIDDVTIAGTDSLDVRKAINDTVFGKIGRFKNIRNQTRAFLEGVSPTFAQIVNKMFGDIDDPQINKLRKRYLQIDEDLKKPENASITSDLIDEQLRIEAVLKKEAPTLQNSIARAWTAGAHLVAGRKSGKFKDMESLSKGLYGKLSNIGRLSAFYQLRKRGVAPGEAVKRIDTFMQNYSKVPRTLRKAAKGPLGSPLVSFPYEAARIASNLVRYKPGFILGGLSTIASTNFMNMVGGGLNPYRVWEDFEGEGVKPAWLQFATTLVFPHHDGTFSTSNVPGLDLFEAFSQPFGIQGQLLNADDKNQSYLARAGKAVLGKFAFAQPSLGLALAGISGRDPKTGMILQDKSSFWGKASAQFFGNMLPPDTPFIGNASRQITEGFENPPHSLSGRKVSLGQRTLQRSLGLKLRGKLGSGIVAGKVAETIGGMLGISALTDIPVENKPTPGIGVKDQLTAALYASGFDEQNAVKLERIQDGVYRDLRIAHNLLQSSDPEEKRVGREMRDKAIATAEENFAAIGEFNGIEFERKFTEQEKFKLFQRAHNSQDFNNRFDDISVVRKARVAITMALQDHQEEAERLFKRMILTDQEQFRYSSNVSKIQESISLLQDFTSNPPTPVGQERAQQVLRYLSAVVLPKAIQDAQIDALESRINGGAADIFELEER